MDWGGFSPVERFRPKNFEVETHKGYIGWPEKIGIAISLEYEA
jgi:hypothetical protein